MTREELADLIFPDIKHDIKYFQMQKRLHIMKKNTQKEI